MAELAVKPNKDVNQVEHLKAAERVRKTIATALYGGKTKQIDCDKVLVSIHNRDGGMPNIMCIHHTILHSFRHDGWCATRAAWGVCVEVKSPEAKRAHLEHNKRFSKGNKLLPAIDEGFLYVSLHNTHYNISLRIAKAGGVGPHGSFAKEMDRDALFKDAVMNGHHWLVLPEDTPKEEQLLLSSWMNQNQNSNQQSHEVEILQTIQSCAAAMYENRKGNLGQEIVKGDLTQRALKQNRTTISTRFMTILVGFFHQFCVNEREDLLQELQAFHSNYVDPKKVALGCKFVEILKEKAFNDFPLTRFYLALTQYTPEKTVEVSGQSIAAFIDTSTLQNFAKNAEGIYNLDKKLKENRTKYARILEESLGTIQGKLELAHLNIFFVRMVLKKGWPKSYPEGIRQINVKCTVPAGKYSDENADAVTKYWAKLLDHEYPAENLANKLSLEEQMDTPKDSKKKKEAELEESQDALDVGLFRRLKRQGSTGGTSDESLPANKKPSAFKPGDEITVSRRNSLWAPHPNPGPSGVVGGWAIWVLKYCRLWSDGCDDRYCHQ